MENKRDISGTRVTAVAKGDRVIEYYEQGRLIFTTLTPDDQMADEFPPDFAMQMAVHAYHAGRAAGEVDGMILRSNEFRELLLMGESE